MAELESQVGSTFARNSHRTLEIAQYTVVIRLTHLESTVIRQLFLDASTREV
jgi:hypothetical protein